MKAICHANQHSHLLHVTDLAKDNVFMQPPEQLIPRLPHLLCKRPILRTSRYTRAPHHANFICYPTQPELSPPHSLSSSKQSLTSHPLVPNLSPTAYLRAVRFAWEVGVRDACDDGAVRPGVGGVGNHPVRSVGCHSVDGCRARLPGTPGGALVRIAGHAGVSPLASVRVVVRLRCLCAGHLQHRRQHRCMQQSAGVDGGHWYGYLAGAPGSPSHDLWLGALGRCG